MALLRFTHLLRLYCLILLPIQVQGDCHQGFFEVESLPEERTSALVTLYDFLERSDFIYPDLKFTCNGTVTLVAFGAFFSSNRDVDWGTVMTGTLSIWRPSGLTYNLVQSYVIEEDLSQRDNTYGLSYSTLYGGQSYSLLINTVLRVVQDNLEIPVLSGDVVGLSLPPQVDPWEDAIPVIYSGGTADSVMLSESTSASCWSASEGVFVQCHSVVGQAQPHIAVEFRPADTSTTPSPSSVLPLENIPESSDVVSPTGSSSASTYVDLLTSTTRSPIAGTVTASTTVPVMASLAPLRNENGLIATVGVLASLLGLAIVTIAALGVFISCKLRQSKGQHTIKGDNTSQPEVVLMGNPAYSASQTLNSQRLPGVDNERPAYEDPQQDEYNTYDIPRSSEQVQGYDHLKRDEAEAQVTILDHDTGTSGPYSTLSSSVQYKNLSAANSSSADVVDHHMGGCDQCLEEAN